MPRSRGSDASQRQSPRVPLHLKTTVCSEANGVVRHSVDRSSPKVGEHRSPRSPLHVHEKKRGARVADLETKLAQTQEELKKLKEQLANAEATKRDAQHELEVTKIRIQTQSGATEEENEEETSEPEEVVANVPEESVNCPATDVFEVVMNATSTPTDSNLTDEAGSGKDEREESEETKAMIEGEVKEREEELGKSNAGEASVAVSDQELNLKLTEKEKEFERLVAENESLRNQVEEERVKAVASRAKEEEMSSKMENVEEDMREFRRKVERLEEKVEEAEGAKEALEWEMKKLRVQTDQWRKAAEAAAAVLGGREEGIGRRVGDRCGSMDKHLHLGGFGGGGGGGFVGLPGMEEDGLSGGGKRRSSGGMKMFAELWKKGQK